MSEVAGDGEFRDALPEDLNAAGYVGVYQFPDNSRRRVPGVLYLVIAAICLLTWVSRRSDAVLINRGFLWTAVLLGLAGVLSITSGWRMTLTETDALVEATKACGVPVGHASAQLAWRGLRSRPTWRILCYSTEEPPTRRGFVLIDAIDGSIVSRLTEENPEEWASD
jgi:hypothetical protein